jgi:hypothetical protein
LGDVVISQGGVVPHINPEVCCYLMNAIADVLIGLEQLLPTKTKKKGEEE